MTTLLDLLFPPHCAGCEVRGVALCRDCLDELEPAPDRDPPPGLDAVWSLVDYDGGGRQLVGALKYDGRREALRVLGSAMGRLPDRAVDVVTWAPTTPSHRRRRGFDQAELLARRVARATGTRCRRLLVRPEGRSQIGLDRAERSTGVRFVARGEVARRVLVVDDVVTTGATMTAAAAALRDAGAVEVLGLTLASVR